MYFQTLSPILWRWGIRLGVAGVVGVSAIASSSSRTQAQVVADPTLGSVVTDTGGGVQTITNGTTRDTNLFHSFQQFSVPTNGTAFFNNATNIQNILTRVTGGSVSNIDGLIRANGTANLFLLNPNGIIFGANARLNIGGSFIATTARSLNFADGTQFSATPGAGEPLLTVSVPLGLQFGTNPGDIINRASGVGLQVQPGRTLGLIGGNLSIDGGNLTARGGRIELGAVASPALVGLNTDNSGLGFSFPTDLALGDISLINDSLVDTRAGGGGSIAVNARNLSLFGGSEIVSGIRTNQGTVGAVSGDIDINAQGAISIDGRNQEGFSSGFFNNVEEGGTGRGGNINVRTGSLSLTNRGAIAASTFAAGDAGNVNITARDGVSLDNSRIFSQVNPAAIGNGGNIKIAGRSLSLTSEARLNTPTLGQGNAGNIQIDTIEGITVNGGSSVNTFSDSRGNAGSVTITAGGLVSFDGVGSDGLPSGVFGFLNRTPEAQSDRRAGDINIQARSFSVTNGARLFTQAVGGNAGNIQIDVADDVLVSGGAGLSAFSSGRGNAGNVTINAGNRISLDNGIILSVLGSEGIGRGGDVRIQARSLSLTNDASIYTATLGQGDAGNIQVDTTDDVSINGSSLSLFSSGNGNAGNLKINAGDRISLDGSIVFSNLFPGGTGRGGDVTIKARSLSLINGADLSTSTFGRGDAGNVFVQVDDSISLSNSSIFSNVEAGGVGNGGTVDIKADSLSLTDGAQIQAAVRGASDTLPGGRGNGGKVAIELRDDFNARGTNSRGNLSGVFTRVGAGAEGRGGDIEIKAGRLSLDNGAVLNASTLGTGDAGNIFLRIDNSISLVNSNIFSSVGAGGVGNGSTIDIQARSLDLTDGAQIVAALDSSEDALPGGRGNGGRVIIDVRDRFSASGRDSDGFRSGVFTTVGTGAVGDGGTIEIQARSLDLTDGGRLSTSSFGQGNAGNINVDVRTLDLDGGGIFATSASGDGGNIRLQASNSLRLRNGSRVSTSAGGTEQPGDGGNITIDSPLVIANVNGNNDITANAFNGRGGRIEINAQSIFGLTPRSRQELQTLLGTDTPTAEDFLNALDNSNSNDVAAISLTNPSLSGTVSFNAADIDPSRDIVELPTGLVDASALVASGCPSGAENRFVVAGRGGLPPAPGDKLSADAILTDWATLQTPETGDRATIEKTNIPEAANTTPTPPVETLTEATTWQFSPQGEVVLTANTSNIPNDFGVTPTSCSGS
jgi:filamentous hemagglutinin family protein